MKMIALTWLILIIICSIWYAESRNYYYNTDRTRCLTVWKRIGGNCLIIPGKYSKPWAPDSEFILTTNNNAVTIVWNKSSPDSLVVLNDYGFPLKLNFHSYKVKYYPENKRKEFVSEYYRNGKIKLDYLMLDIKEQLAIVNGKKV